MNVDLTDDDVRAIARILNTIDQRIAAERDPNTVAGALPPRHTHSKLQRIEDGDDDA